MPSEKAAEYGKQLAEIQQYVARTDLGSIHMCRHMREPQREESTWKQRVV
jgi:hypothetical protein